MIPIPKHLREIAEVTDSKAEKLTVKISCPCGCRKFLILKNISQKVKVAPEIAEKIKLSKKWWNDVFYKNDDVKQFSGDRISCVIKYRSKPTLVHNFKEGEVPLNYMVMMDLQPQDYNAILKAVCADCGKEYLLFDNRMHGNDAADFKPDSFEKSEEYVFKKKKIGGSDAPVEVTISLKNFWDFDDIASNGNEGLSADDYSEMFNDIKIKAVTANGKTVTVYSEDLG